MTTGAANTAPWLRLGQTLLMGFVWLCICSPFAPSQAQDRALIVAIDRFADASLADLPGKLAENDATAIKKLLTSRLGFKEADIKILKNKAASRDAIMRAFRGWLNPGGSQGEQPDQNSLVGVDASGVLDKKKKQKKKAAKPKPKKRAKRAKPFRSYFYFAGLGTTVEDVSGDEQDGRDEALIPYDAQLDSADGSFILDDEIEEALASFKRRHVTMVLDTSHSGVVTRSINLAEADTVRMRAANADYSVRSLETEDWLKQHKSEGAFVRASIPGGSLQIWSAASATQTALIAGPDAIPNGLFTLLYVEGLQAGKADLNGNNIISNAELLRHITDGSDAYCRAFSQRCELGLKPRLDPASAYSRTAWHDKKNVTNRKMRTLNLKRLEDLLSGHRKGSIEITQTPASPVHVGTDGIRYSVRTDIPGQIILLNLTDNGRLFQLYPNQFSGPDGAARIKLASASNVLTVPDGSYGMSLSATEVGSGHIIALVVPDAVRFDDAVSRREITSVSNAEAIGHYLSRLSAALNGPIYHDDPANNTQAPVWYLEALPYEVLPKKLAAPQN